MRHSITLTIAVVVVLAMMLISTAMALKDNEEVNILEVMQKIPMIAPFLSSRVGGACSSKLNAFSTEITLGVEKLKGKKQSYVPVIKKAWCLLGKQCTKEVVDSSMALIKGGGFMEQMVKSQLPEGLDVANLDKVIMMYYMDFCEKIGRGEEAAGDDKREEL